MTARRVLAAAALALAALASGCGPAPHRWTAANLELPKAYRAEGEGTVRLDDLPLPGRVRVDYLVYPDGTVAMGNLHTWLRDVDIVTHFLFWETSRERLRCTEFSNREVIVGRLDTTASQLVFPSSAARLSGLSFDSRQPDRTCPGLARQITAENNSELRIVHDPAADRFALDTRLAARYDGNDLTVRIAVEGDFLNRPPVPEIGVGGPSIDPDLIQGGCPPILGTNPPGAAPNDPRGLLLRLVSSSSDPDGDWRRSDIIREEWSHSAGTSGAPFELIGRGRVAGPYLFESDMEHWLMLTVWDRTGASSRDLCQFRVLRPDEVPAS
jgi:hypothetical protein